MCKIFKENRLNITVSCNLATTHFSDVYKAAPDCNTALKKSGFHENRK